MTLTGPSGFAELAGLNFGAAAFGAADELSPDHDRSLLLEVLGVVGADRGVDGADEVGVPPATLTPRTTVI